MSRHRRLSTSILKRLSLLYLCMTEQRFFWFQPSAQLVVHNYYHSAQQCTLEVIVMATVTVSTYLTPSHSHFIFIIFLPLYQYHFCPCSPFHVLFLCCSGQSRSIKSQGIFSGQFESIDRHSCGNLRLTFRLLYSNMMHIAIDKIIFWCINVLIISWLDINLCATCDEIFISFFKSLILSLIVHSPGILRAFRAQNWPFSFSVPRLKTFIAVCFRLLQRSCLKSRGLSRRF